MQWTLQAICILYLRCFNLGTCWRSFYLPQCPCNILAFYLFLVISVILLLNKLKISAHVCYLAVASGHRCSTPCLCCRLKQLRLTRLRLYFVNTSISWRILVARFPVLYFQRTRRHNDASSNYGSDVNCLNRRKNCPCKSFSGFWFVLPT